MKKRIFCLCFVLIALIGISGVSACYADNSTVVDSNLGLSLKTIAFPFQMRIMIL